MKNLKYIIIITLFLSACGVSEEEKKINNFLSNFDEIELPYFYKASNDEPDFKKIEEENIGILQDTVGNAIYNSEFDIYYIGKISTNNDFHTIIIGEYIHEQANSYMYYQLFTLSKEGKVISSIYFNGKINDFGDVEYVNFSINKNLEIERVSYMDVYNEKKDAFINEYKIFEKYKIAEDGNIQFISEYYETNEDMGYEEINFDPVDFKQLNLPYKITEGKFGELIRNKEQLVNYLLKNTENTEALVDGYEMEDGMNTYTAVGIFMETDNYKAIIYQHYSDSHGLPSEADYEYMGNGSMYFLESKYYLVTYTKNDRLIDRKLIGEFRSESLGSADYKYETESTIVLNKDATVNVNEILTEYVSEYDVSQGEPETNVREFDYKYKILQNGIIKLENEPVLITNEGIDNSLKLGMLRSEIENKLSGTTVEIIVEDSNAGDLLALKKGEKQICLFHEFADTVYVILGVDNCITAEGISEKSTLADVENVYTITEKITDQTEGDPFIYIRIKELPNLIIIIDYFISENNYYDLDANTIFEKIPKTTEINSLSLEKPIK